MGRGAKLCGQEGSGQGSVRPRGRAGSHARRKIRTCSGENMINIAKPGSHSDTARFNSPRPKCLRFVLIAVASGILAQIAHAQDRTVDLLRTLSEAPGPSGFEEPVRKIMVHELSPYSDEISYDGLGSVIARQGARGPRIMLDAHMDEVGGMVRHVTRDGFLSMQMLGGVLDQALPD